jgi:hypothetical protein
MTPEHLAELNDNATLRKRVAKRMARDSFRNTKKLEDMHAVGRISQDEMKALIVEVVVPETSRGEFMYSMDCRP